MMSNLKFKCRRRTFQTEVLLNEQTGCVDITFFCDSLARGLSDCNLTVIVSGNSSHAKLGPAGGVIGLRVFI